MTSTPTRYRSTYAVVLMLLLLVVTPLVLGAWGQGYDGKNYTTSGGMDATNGTIRVDDAWVDAPTGVTTGAHAALRLQLANDSTHSDALQGVSTPVAAHVRLMLHDKPVRSLHLKPWSAGDLEWPTHGAGIELVGVNRPLQVGQWFPVILRFQHSRPITMQITVGPLAQGAGSS